MEVLLWKGHFYFTFLSSSGILISRKERGQELQKPIIPLFLKNGKYGFKDTSKKNL